MTFEYFLKYKHGDQYYGTDDNMDTDFELWLKDISIDKWIAYAQEYHKEESISMLNTIEDDLSRAEDRIDDDVSHELDPVYDYIWKMQEYLK